MKDLNLAKFQKNEITIDNNKKFGFHEDKFPYQKSDTNALGKLKSACNASESNEVKTAVFRLRIQKP